MFARQDSSEVSISRLVAGGVTLAAVMLLAGCQAKTDSASGALTSTSANNASAKSSSSEGSAVPERWLGKWNGPEGTFLEVSKSGEKYQVTIQNLDGPRTFDAVPVGSQLQFTRDGQSETIHAGNGEDAGMKWLLDKKNCLVIRKGEGFCRD